MKTEIRSPRLVTAALLVTSLTMSSAILAKNGIAYEEEQNRITPGMSQQQVVNQLGKPIRIKTYAFSQDVNWIYKAASTSRGEYQVSFSPEGEVVSAQVVIYGPKH